MLTVITGPMFSGKTAELIRRVNRDRIGGKRVQIFKFRADARYGKEKQMASYDGIMLEAIPTTTTQEIMDKLDHSMDLIVIDEIQFYDDRILAFVRALVDMGTDVICAGLNLDFRGEAFCFKGKQYSMADLMVYADKLVKISAVCTYRDNGKTCGSSASRTQRLINGSPAPYESPVVQLGTSDLYEARCIKHHFVPGRPVPQIKLESAMQLV